MKLVGKVPDDVSFDVLEAANRLSLADEENSIVSSSATSSLPANICKAVGVVAVTLGVAILAINSRAQTTEFMICLATVISGFFVFCAGSGLQYLFDIRNAVLRALNGGVDA